MSLLVVGCSFSDESKKTPLETPTKATNETSPEEDRAQIVARSVGQMLQKGPATKIVVGLINGPDPKIYASGPGADADTVFELGSFTRLFTALLLAEAVARGEVQLSAHVDGFLPLGVKTPQVDGTAISFRHLATESSGLLPVPPNFAWTSRNPYAAYPITQLFADLPRAFMFAKPGTEYWPSAFGMGLLGVLLASTAKTTYAELVRDRILDPLGLTRTSFAYPDDNYAEGHDPKGQSVKPWDFDDGYAGAGGLRASTRDVVAFVAAMLRPSGTLATALRTMTKAQGNLGTTKSFFGQHRMALGWEIPRDSEERRVFEGLGAGSYVYARIDLEKLTGVVLVADASKRLWADGLANDLDNHW